MPELGVKFASRSELLTLQELHQLSLIFSDLGINKIRITGGEPFARPGIITLLEEISNIPAVNEISITTNGSLTTPYVQKLKEFGINKINISLDSLNKNRFFEITRRDDFEEVYGCVLLLLAEGFDVKLNSVISTQKNIEDILPLVELTKHHHLSVRFLEAMPFNGSEDFLAGYNYKNILEYISGHYTNIERLGSEENGTSINYRLENYVGTFGIIPSFSRTFCGTCNRIRLSATGELRTCLYGPPAANLREELRAGATAGEIEETIIQAVAGRVRNGFEAEAWNKESSQLSMSALGG
jgi:cyclic pyranopterin phosphate synthase